MLELPTKFSTGTIREAVTNSKKFLKEFVNKVGRDQDIEFWLNDVYIMVRKIGDDEILHLYRHASVLEYCREFAMVEREDYYGDMEYFAPYLRSEIEKLIEKCGTGVYMSGYRRVLYNTLAVIRQSDPHDHALDGWYSSEQMEGYKASGKPDYTDSSIERDPCTVCGGSMYFFGRRTEDSYQSFHRCNDCGWGYEF